MANPLFEPVSRYFGLLRSQYGFCIKAQEYHAEGFGSGWVRLESDRHFIEFNQEGLGPTLTVSAGKIGQPGTDLAWIFAYLIRTIAGAPSSAAAPWLYYTPHIALGIWGEESVTWQLDRMADVLQSMWLDIFLFLDNEGPRSPDFTAFIDQANRSTAERAEDGYHLKAEHLAARRGLNFAPLVEKSFTFLSAYNFRIINSDPVFVRYETPGPRLGIASASAPIYINIFHRLRSYQLGLQIGRVMSDPMVESNFDIEELAAWASLAYQPQIAQNSAELQNGLNRLARTFRRSAAPALAGDPRLFDALLARRIDAARRASRTFAERSRR